jgi:hypothetical protein
MKKEDLTALGLTEEQIAEIQKLNGKDIQKEQDKISKIELERDNFKGQLETAQETLKGFEGVDVKDMQSKIEQLNKDLKARDDKYQADIADRDFNSLLDSQITSVGAKNAKAVKALLDIDALKGSKNQTEDIKKALEAVKTDNDYLFGSDEPINKGVKSTGGTPPAGDANTAALRAAMGLKPAE